MSREQDRIKKKSEKNPITECSKMQQNICAAFFNRVNDTNKQGVVLAMVALYWQN